MGHNFSYIDNRDKAAHLQRVYDTALALMIVNLIVAFLPVTGLYWIPQVGPWFQFGFELLGLAFAIVIYRMSKNFIPQDGGKALNRAMLIMTILTIFFTFCGAIAQSVQVDKVMRCRNDLYAEHQKRMSQTPSYQCEPGVPCAVPAYYYEPNYWSCGSYDYFGPSIFINAILVPIMAFVSMVLFSIRCSALWNEAVLQGAKLAGPNFAMPGYGAMSSVVLTMPAGGQMMAPVVAAAPQGMVAVPAEQYGLFAQYMAQQSQAAPITEAAPAYMSGKSL